MFADFLDACREPGFALFLIYAAAMVVGLAFCVAATWSDIKLSLAHRRRRACLRHRSRPLY